MMSNLLGKEHGATLPYKEILKMEISRTLVPTCYRYSCNKVPAEHINASIIIPAENKHSRDIIRLQLKDGVVVFTQIGYIYARHGLY